MEQIHITNHNPTNSRIDIRQAEYEKRKQDYFLRTHNQTVELTERPKDARKQVKT
jgi:hypothetical protein